MAFVAPTASDLKARFPEFGSVSNDLINLILAEALPKVGETWIEADRRPAILYLAAHLLSMEGEPARSSSGVGISATGPLKRRKVGDVEVEYAGGGEGGGSSDASGYMLSHYGRRYRELMRANFPAIRAV